MIGDIEGWLEGEADWSYRVQVYTGSQWIEQNNDDYSSNEDDHTEDVTHRFHVQTPTPRNNHKSLGSRYCSPGTIADVSGYTGGETVDKPTDVRGARSSIVDIISSPTNSYRSIRSSPMEDIITTSGTYQPDGGDNSDRGERRESLVPALRFLRTPRTKSPGQWSTTRERKNWHYSLRAGDVHSGKHR